jgi:ribosomal protein S3AE
MAKVVVKKNVKKAKRKFPVTIKAPDSFKSVDLGKSQVTDLNSLIGKSIKINLMYVTKSIKNQNVRLVFKVNAVNSGVANTEIVSYSQIPYYLNRFVKAGSDLIEDSFVCESKDGRKLRVKPFVITKKNTSGMALSAVREKVKEIISKDASTMSAEEFIVAVTSGKVQVGFRNEAKKIFPLKAFEFRKVVIE